MISFNYINCITMIELHPTRHHHIIKGDCPLSHDCILKVYSNSVPRTQLFSCRSQDSYILTDIISKMRSVRKVEIIPFDEYEYDM